MLLSKFIIKGGIPLKGEVNISGAKNAAIKMIAAALFSDEEVVISNVPRINNVYSDIETARELGAKVDWVSENTLSINANNLSSFEVPYEHGSKHRTTLLFTGPLLFRFGKARIPKPGGCKIGLRSINRFVQAWETLGAKVTEERKHFYIELINPTPGAIEFDINTHTGTENAILSSIFISGETTILNAAQEPEVDDLISLLNLMGANVRRVEDRIIKISGVDKFTGAKLDVIADHIEAVTFAIAAAVTRGDITIKNVNTNHILSLLSKFDEVGVKYESLGESLRVWAEPDTIYKPVNIETAPAPGFMTDWQQLFTLLLTQAQGESLVHETIFTNRFSYTKDLNRMGAKIELKKPSEVGINLIISADGYDIKNLGEPLTVAKIEGPTKLRSARLTVPDLRAGATLVIAALIASGKSEILGIEQIDRGYERLDEKLRALGGDIERVE